MNRPTNRSLLSDAERIMRALVDPENDLYVYDDVRDWLRNRSLQVKEKKQ